MNSISLPEAKIKRTIIKSSLTRHKNVLENFDATQGLRHDITERKKKLIDLWDQFDSIQSRIEVVENEKPSISNKNELLAQQDEHRTNFKTTYFNLVSRCESLLEYFNQHNAQTSAVHENIVRVSTLRESRVRLPKIELPVFLGAYDDWYSYQDVFEKLIHDNERHCKINRH